MKAIEFLRVSTSEQGQDDRAGIPRQMQVNAMTAKKFHLTIIKTVRMVDVSGTSVLQTPEVKELLQLIKSPDVSGIIVADWDRLIRLDNFRDFALLENLKETHTKIYLPDQEIDLNTQAGFLSGGIHSIISGNELTQIKKRMIQAKEVKRRNGEHPNNLLSLPMGVSYRYEAREYFYTDEIQKVKELFNLFVNEGVQGYGELEKLTGIRRRTIANLLRNELFIGYRAYIQKRSTEKRIRPDGRQADRKKVKRPPEEVIRVRVIEKAAIDEQVFYQVREILTKKNNEYHKKRSDPGQRFLYSGFLRCGVCGNIMYTTSGGRKRNKDYYYCRTKNYQFLRKNGRHVCQSRYLPRQEAEDTVTSFVMERLTDSTYLKQFIHAALTKDGIQELQSLAGELRKERKEIRAKRSRILDLYGEGLFGKPELDEKVSELNSELSDVERRLAKIEEKRRVRTQFITDQSILSIVTTMAEFPFWQAAQKRAFLGSQIPEFSLTKDGITGFTLNFCKLGTHTDTGSWPPPA
jgi:site-specific DNA recombinase